MNPNECQVDRTAKHVGILDALAELEKTVASLNDLNNKIVGDSEVASEKDRAPQPVSLSTFLAEGSERIGALNQRMTVSIESIQDMLF